MHACNNRQSFIFHTNTVISNNIAQELVYHDPLKNYTVIIIPYHHVEVDRGKSNSKVKKRRRAIALAHVRQGII